jgi:hypothetical protein
LQRYAQLREGFGICNSERERDVYETEQYLLGPATSSYVTESGLTVAVGLEPFVHCHGRRCFGRHLQGSGSWKREAGVKPTAVLEKSLLSRDTSKKAGVKPTAVLENREDDTGNDELVGTSATARNTALNIQSGLRLVERRKREKT